MIAALYELPLVLVVLALAGLGWFMVRTLRHLAATRVVKVGLTISAGFAAFGLFTALTFLLAAVSPHFFGAKLFTYLLTHAGQPALQAEGTQVLVSLSIRNEQGAWGIYPPAISTKDVNVFMAGKVIPGQLEIDQPLTLDLPLAQPTSLWWLFTDTNTLTKRVALPGAR